MFTQDMSTHGNFERLTHLPFAPPINMKALSNVRQRTANGMANCAVLQFENPATVRINN